MISQEFAAKSRQRKIETHQPSKKRPDDRIGARSPAIGVTRVRTRATLELPEVKELVLRAVTGTRYPGTTPSKVYLELLGRISEDALGVFVSRDDSGPRSVAVVLLPTSNLMMYPQVALVYSEGPPTHIKAVLERVRGWLRKAGHERALGINLWRSDRAFMRGFCHFGKPSRMGSLIAFDLT
jgi:hypothetical protein